MKSQISVVKNWTRSHLIIISITLFYPLIELFQGFVFKGDVSKAFTNVFSAIVIGVCGICIAPSYKKFTPLELVVLALVVLSLTTTAIKGYVFGGVAYDFFALLRSIIAGVFVYSTAKSLSTSEKKHTIRFASIYLWFVVTISVIFSYYTGVGLHTYGDFSSGSKFYFPSINELTFIYIASWMFLYFSFQRNPVVQYVSLAITVFTFTLLGNKSFIIIISVFFVLWTFFKSSKTKQLIYLASALLLLLISVYSGLLSMIFNSIISLVIYFLSNYSSGAEKFLTKLSYLDVSSALISERDMLFYIALDLFKAEYSIFDTVFGLNLSSYGLAYGLIRTGKFSFSENDVVDVFMSYGALGISIILLLIYRITSNKSSEVIVNSAAAKKTFCIVFLINGFLTGHIFLFGITCFVFSLYSGILSENSGERACRLACN